MDATIVALIIGGITAVVAGVPPTIVAWAVYRQTVANKNAAAETKQAVVEAKQVIVDTAKSADASSRIAAETSAKASTILEKTVEIHTLTNGNLSKVTTALETANEKIAGLEKLMAALAQQKTEATAEKLLSDAKTAAAQTLHTAKELADAKLLNASQNMPDAGSATAPPVSITEGLDASKTEEKDSKK